MPEPHRNQARRGEALPALMLLAPFGIAFLLFFLLPTLETFYMSLTDSSLTRTNGFIGLANYATLARDPSFWSAVRISVARSSPVCGANPFSNPTACAW